MICPYLTLHMQPTSYKSFSHAGRKTPKSSQPQVTWSKFSQKPPNPKFLSVSLQLLECRNKFQLTGLHPIQTDLMQGQETSGPAAGAGCRSSGTSSGPDSWRTGMTRGMTRRISKIHLEYIIEELGGNRCAGLQNKNKKPVD